MPPPYGLIAAPSLPVYVNRGVLENTWGYLGTQVLRIDPCAVDRRGRVQERAEQ